MKTAVLSNINLNPLKVFLAQKEIYFAGYGQYVQELINPNSSVNTKDFDMIFLHLEGEEFIKEILESLMTTQEARQIIAEKLKLLSGALTQYMQKHPAASVLLTTIVFPPFVFSNYLDVNSPYSLRTLEGYINEELMEWSKKFSQLYLMDWRSLVLSHGYKQIVDEKFWYLGRIKYTSGAFKALALEIQNITRAIEGKAKKILALDLDNTLWGGILGEDGAGGINLSEEGIGKAYRDFQRAIKSLIDLGVLLAVNSKNNPEDVEEVFADHPMMILKKEDFVSFKVNWNNKADNLKEMANELNLGLESFVFIDDSPREREMVKALLPQVSVPEFVQDPAFLKTWFLEKVVYPEFPKVFVTSEDRAKSTQYKALGQRNELAKELCMEEFIKQLGIEIGFYVNDKRLIQRTAQLTQKTNQFNMTTRRYTEAEVDSFMNNPQTVVFNLDYRDKFGSEGVVGAAIVRKKESVGYLDSFLLSCRIIGRSVEYVLLYKILDYLKGQRIKEVSAEFIPTPKNSVAQDFYKNTEFMRMEQREASVYFQDTIETLLASLQKKYKIEDMILNTAVK